MCRIVDSRLSFGGNAALNAGTWPSCNHNTTRTYTTSTSETWKCSLLGIRLAPALPLNLGVSAFADQKMWKVPKMASKCGEHQSYSLVYSLGLFFSPQVLPIIIQIWHHCIRVALKLPRCNGNSSGFVRKIKSQLQLPVHDSWEAWPVLENIFQGKDLWNIHIGQRTQAVITAEALPLHSAQSWKCMPQKQQGPAGTNTPAAVGNTWAEFWLPVRSIRTPDVSIRWCAWIGPMIKGLRHVLIGSKMEKVKEMDSSPQIL